MPAWPRPVKVRTRAPAASYTLMTYWPPVGIAKRSSVEALNGFGVLASRRATAGVPEGVSVPAM